MRREFQMTEDQRASIMEACKPTPAMWDSSGNYLFGTPQENANRAWQTLADALGFKWDTVRPVPGKSDDFFTAEMRDES